MYYLGIDLGGTNVASAVVNENGKIISRGHRPCPRGNNAVAAAIIDAAQDAVKAANLTMEAIGGVGLGSPGSIDSKRGVVIDAYNLQLKNAPLCEMVSEGLGVPVKIGNDANVAAYGEFMFGAGRGVQDMIAITLGTGLGCGMVFGGKLYEGFNGFAGEAGHMIVIPHGRLCTCGRSGCLEAYASATGLITSATEAAKYNPQSALNSVVNGDLSKMTGKLFFDALATDDAIAVQVFEEFVNVLAQGLGNIVNLLQPEVICIGGGIAGVGDVLFQPLRKALQLIDFAGETNARVKILGAELGNDAGIIGAAMLVR